MLFEQIPFETMIDRFPKSLIEQLKATEQNPKWHPEGSVYNHIKLVYEQARKHEISDLAICAIFHDLGKIDTTKEKVGSDGKVHLVSYGHEVMSKKYLDEYLIKLFWFEMNDKDLIYWVCENHMRIHLLHTGAMKDPKKIDALRSNKYFSALDAFGKFDDMGKGETI